MILGNDCIKQLNILENGLTSVSNAKIKCLLDVVNMASTNMGKRFVKHAITNPLNNDKEINLRYDCTEELITLDCNFDKCLKYICDIEKFNRKIVGSNISPNDFYNLIDSYIYVQKLYELVSKTKLNVQFLPEQIYIDQTDTFIKSCQKTFAFDELRKYNYISDIETSLFNKGLYGEIDKLVDVVKSNGLSMDQVGAKLAEYIDEVINKDEMSVKRGKR